MRKNGEVYWITGLSGAGKTTIGNLLYKYLKKQQKNIVLLDGDSLRSIFNCKGYSNEERNELAFKYSNLCMMLANQGIDVIICTIAMFDNVRAWNRRNISNYNEIYLKVPIDVLIMRDQKKLYSRALKNKVENVIGINCEWEEPKQPDLIIDNDGKKSPDEILIQLINYMKDREK